MNSKALFLKIRVKGIILRFYHCSFFPPARYSFGKVYLSHKSDRYDWEPTWGDFPTFSIIFSNPLKNRMSWDKA